MATAFSGLINKLKDLPVADVARDVVNSVQSGKVTILASDTGSGKTLVANSLLADQSDEQVVVLVPRRFLAMNAAETIAELSGTQLGKDVGYVVGGADEDSSKHTPDTKLLFTTYGYAVSSGLINRAKTVVLDEVHEAGMDISLARAVLHNRLKSEGSLKVLEMSATMDVNKNANYWSDVSQTDIFETDGKTFPCEQRHIIPEADEYDRYGREDQEKELAKTVLNLIKDDDRKGVAVFLPGKGEIASIEAELKYLIQKSDLDVEIASLHGEMDSSARKEALQAPEDGKAKILLGTNAIESGMNIPWLDAGVSDGRTRVASYDESGTFRLDTIPLPKWRLTQQEGRVKRFRDGIFVLFHDQGFDARVEYNMPEIESTPLDRIVMHCAKIDINPEDLSFDADVDRDRLISTRERLSELGLITEDYRLTEAGKYVSKLPVEPVTGAMMWHADRMNITDDAIALAALRDIETLKANMRIPTSKFLGFKNVQGEIVSEKDYNHRIPAFDHFDETSETLNTLGAFWKVLEEEKRLAAEYDLPNAPKDHKAHIEEEIENQLFAEGEQGAEQGIATILHVSKKRYRDMKLKVRDIRDALGLPVDTPTKGRATQEQLQELMLISNPNALFLLDGDQTHPVSDSRDEGAVSYYNDEIKVSHSSVANRRANMRHAVTSLKEIPTRRGDHITLATNVDRIPDEVIFQAAVDNEGLLASPSFEIVQGDYSEDYRKKVAVTFDYLGKGEITFDIPAAPSTALSALIEPKYSSYMHDKAAELYAEALGISSENAANALSEAKDLKALPEQIAQTISAQHGIPVTFTTGDTPVADGMMRLQTIEIGCSQPNIHVDIPEHSLTAEQFSMLLTKHPKLSGFKNLTDRDHNGKLATLGVYLDGDQIHLYTEKDGWSYGLWENTDGASIESVGARLMKPRQHIERHENRFTDLPNRIARTFDALLEPDYDDEINDYVDCKLTEEERLSVAALKEHFQKQAQGLCVSNEAIELLGNDYGYRQTALKPGVEESEIENLLDNARKEANHMDENAAWRHEKEEEPKSAAYEEVDQEEEIDPLNPLAEAFRKNDFKPTTVAPVSNEPSTSGNASQNNRTEHHSPTDIEQIVSTTLSKKDAFGRQVIDSDTPFAAALTRAVEEKGKAKPTGRNTSNIDDGAASIGEEKIRS